MYDVRHGKPDFDEGAAGVGKSRSSGSLMPVLIVLGFGATIVVGVVALAGTAGLYVVLAISGLLGFAALHYVLWGWWLTNRLKRDEGDEED